jgi:hypothetical protein
MANNSDEARKFWKSKKLSYNISDHSETWRITRMKPKQPVMSGTPGFALPTHTHTHTHTQSSPHSPHPASLFRYFVTDAV